MLYYGALCYPCRMEKYCVIATCKKLLSADRLALQPRAVTCSPECTAIHHFNQVKAAQKRRRERIAARKEAEKATA